MLTGPEHWTEIPLWLLCGAVTAIIYPFYRLWQEAHNA